MIRTVMTALVLVMPWRGRGPIDLRQQQRVSRAIWWFAPLAIIQGAMLSGVYFGSATIFAHQGEYAIVPAVLATAAYVLWISPRQLSAISRWMVSNVANNDASAVHWVSTTGVTCSILLRFSALLSLPAVCGNVLTFWVLIIMPLWGKVGWTMSAVGRSLPFDDSPMASTARWVSVPQALSILALSLGATVLAFSPAMMHIGIAITLCSGMGITALVMLVLGPRRIFPWGMHAAAEWSELLFLFTCLFWLNRAG